MSDQYFKPSVTADVLALRLDHGPELLLIQRGRDPFAGFWALPGGFIEENETLLASARRELQEETGLILDELSFFGVYGDPGRDPRGRTITAAYWALLAPGSETGVAGLDDASDARWFPIQQLPELAFDHARIIHDGLYDLHCQLTNRYPGSRRLPEGFDSVHIHQLESWLNR
ncbi:MAG TPA: NUDIX hydrolase [Candidatus Obscuribacterales bacterium]